MKKKKITCIPHSLFFTRVVNMEKLKYFSLMGRKRLWTFYWFKIQTNIIWRAEFESQESRKKIFQNKHNLWSSLSKINELEMNQAPRSNYPFAGNTENRWTCQMVSWSYHPQNPDQGKLCRTNDLVSSINILEGRETENIRGASCRLIDLDTSITGNVWTLAWRQLEIWTMTRYLIILRNYC